MGLFDRQFNEIRKYLARKQRRGLATRHVHQGGTHWPREENRNLVMRRDTAVELGNPRDASISFLLWIDDPDKLNNGGITVVGPDIPEADGRRLSFGKVVIVGGDDFDSENTISRYREMDCVRYDIHLSGYMMRGVSQHGREWSRVSREALRNGFSFKVLGGALIDAFSELPYVRAVETIFITAGRDDLVEMADAAADVMAIVGAMNKMAGEMSFDCDACEYVEVCDEVAELRSMRRSLEKEDSRPLGIE